jgi:translocator protein
MYKRGDMNRVLKIGVSIAIAQAAGIIGSVFTVGSIDTWYAALAKPEWNPPGWVFGPVWIILYTLMGIAAYLVWQHRKTRLAKIALSVYGIQLVLNAVWSILFFGLKNPGLAFAEILLLVAFIAATIILFWRVLKWAGILLLPYLAWVFFAAYLNYTIWQLN